MTIFSRAGLAGLVLAFVWSIFAGAGAARAADPCEALRGFRSGDATVLMAQTAGGSDFHAPDGATYGGLAPFCRLIAVAAPTPQSHIVIEMWLPDAAHWNGKLLGTGNGGFAGTIRYAALAGGIRRGYAVANTDMGTAPAGAMGDAGYSAGNGRPEVVRDWGFRATHEMALAARAAALAYYGQPARHAYYAGCSTGGHQGLTEAQRYPDDYDAILAGAPGHNRTHLHAAFTWFGVIARQPGAFIPPSLMGLWADSLVRACAGKDGGAPGDAFLTQPMQCGYRPAALACRPGQDAKTCFVPAQVAALDRIYDGLRNPRTGKLIYPAEVKGSEALLSLAFTMVGPSHPVAADLQRWAFGAGYDGASFDFDRDMAREDEALDADINANDPDLTRFAARGGKLILYHGWADAVVSPLDTILYYDRIATSGGAPDKSRFVRLFMAPGMSHCAGGAGPDLFGQSAEATAGDADHDLLTALDLWVEQGRAPEAVIASKIADKQVKSAPGADQAVMARPLCAYPAIARFDGRGDPRAASSFRCQTAAPVTFEKPAADYLK